MQPRRVFLLTGLGVVAYLLLSGSFLNIYKLSKTRDKIQGQVQSLQMESEDLKAQIRLSKDPQFLESQAVDRLDLAEESDLVFVFPEF